MTSVFIKVPVTERLPSVGGKTYITDLGELLFSFSDHSFISRFGRGCVTVKWWLQEVQLPTEEEINFKFPLNQHEPHKTTLNVGCRTGANFILNHIKKGGNK